jgi:hypothetical protein
MSQQSGAVSAIVLGPELELRVQDAQGKVVRKRVAEHLTIGRSAASNLVVEGPGVNLIHARVFVGNGGCHELRAVGRAWMTLPEGMEVNRITLGPNVSFRIGGVLVECLEIDVRSRMSNVESGGAEQHSKPAEVIAVEMPRLVVCPTCYMDMTGVPVVARFCPKCGVQLPARDGAGFLIPPEEHSPLFPVYKALREELGEKLSNETPQLASSLIILAYANAMLNLGWRYEHGQGALRNVEEAARCYEKAGRLVRR